MISEIKKKDLKNQGYRIVGNHSAIKICGWTKKSLRGEDICYKEKFYDTKAHLCVQMTPSLNFCNHRCVWCWRDIEFTKTRWKGKVDSPKEIIDGCIKQFHKAIEGYFGYEKVDKKKIKQTHKPQQFAISLSGEPTMYPRLPELIDEIHKRNMTAYLVTNGSYPEAVKNIIGHEPTQFYITLAAPYKELFDKTTNPLTKNAWEKFNKTLRIMKDLKCRRVLRLTLTKGYNLQEPEKYGSFIKNLHFDFVECKGYMHIGYSKIRLKKENMPSHDEIKDFAEKLAKATGLKYIDEKPESSVVLLMKEDREDRIMNFEQGITYV